MYSWLETILGTSEESNEQGVGRIPGNMYPSSQSDSYNYSSQAPNSDLGSDSLVVVAVKMAGLASIALTLYCCYHYRRYLQTEAELRRRAGNNTRELYNIV